MQKYNYQVFKVYFSIEWSNIHVEIGAVKIHYYYPKNKKILFLNRTEPKQTITFHAVLKWGFCFEKRAFVSNFG